VAGGDCHLDHRRIGVLWPRLVWRAGERLAAAVFDAWLPVKDAAPTWCDVLGLTRTASRAEIVAAYRDKAKLAHPDVGGSHEAMTALSRARDAALLTLETWSGRARR
jgi:hypothetical protein